jgi:hypothetical protein
MFVFWHIFTGSTGYLKEDTLIESNDWKFLNKFEVF